jgi:hypothetical protein
MVAHDARNNCFINAVFLSRDQRADGKGAQRIADGKGALRGVLASGERECVGSALALAVDVDAAYLIDQWINQIGNHILVTAENAYLLSVV